VISIISLLLNLILPAVQSAREAARRTQCQNNLRQIGLAANSFESAKQYYPTAGVNSDSIDTTSSESGLERAGWCFQLLPYVEQQALYDYGRSTGIWQRLPQLGGAAVGEVPVNLYVCPNRGQRFLLPGRQVREFPPLPDDDFTFALGDYAAVVSDQIPNLWEDVEKATDEKYSKVWRGIIVLGGHASKLDEKGQLVYVAFPKLQAEDITDGLSNTILVMEKASAASRYHSLAWADWWESIGWIDSSGWSTLRLPFHPLASDDTPREIVPDFGPAADFGFGSSHPNVFNVVFGDGSVRSISLGIDNPYPYDDQFQNENAGPLWKMSIRNDGFPVEISHLD
jgi:prepilin-type processing-associated H-X9-DG protein